MAGRQEVPPLFKVLSAVDRLREKISQFSLKVSSWWKGHTPREGHTSKSVWATDSTWWTF